MKTLLIAFFCGIQWEIHKHTFKQSALLWIPMYEKMEKFAEETETKNYICHWNFKLLKYVHYRQLNCIHNLKHPLWTCYISLVSCLWALKTGMNPRDTPVIPIISKKSITAHPQGGRTLLLFPTQMRSSGQTPSGKEKKKCWQDPFQEMFNKPISLFHLFSNRLFSFPPWISMIYYYGLRWES